MAIRLQWATGRAHVLGEALDGLGRWYVAVPPFLIIGFLAALFFLTGAGQHRLQEASERLKTEIGSLLNDYNVASNGTVLAESEYLDIVATRR